FQAERPAAPATMDVPGEWRVGLGCSPGRVQGRARVVRNPLEAGLAAGDIVVAEHTDPSWILILPLAAGLVVERGSLLSHAAIVARELGIPAVVGLTGAPGWIEDGAMIEIDGGSGVVRRLPAG
ncbi:MAG: phosphoenolpyruvate synthase, partial [Chloroflexi bacterium]